MTNQVDRRRGLGPAHLRSDVVRLERSGARDGDINRVGVGQAIKMPGDDGDPESTFMIPFGGRLPALPRIARRGRRGRRIPC